MNKLNVVLGSLLSLSLALPALADIQKNKEGYYGAGVMIGRPGKAQKRGILFKTDELDLNVGSFSDDAKFVGANMPFSTESDAIFDKIQALSPDKTYVFKFVRKHPLNPEIEDSHMMITDVSELEDFAKSGLPTESVSNEGRHGGFSEGKRVGRIMGVERWGVGPHSVCSVYIADGGLSTKMMMVGRQMIPVTAMGTAGLDIYSEETCQYAEKLARTGASVEIEYSTDFIELWDWYTNVIHKIKVGGHSAPAAAPAAEAAAPVLN
jgi:hypothetical protein